MFVLFFLFALFRNYGASLPITDIPNVLDVRDVIPPAPVAVENHQLRSLFDIVWSCISTVFICTWVAIHPNVPPRGEGHIRSVWRQIKLMLWTLVVPEMVLVWAYRQWAAARYIAKLFEEEGWTPVHGHFLIMGGFSLVKDGVETVLDCESFFELLKIETTLTDTDGENGDYRPIFQEPFEIAFPIITTDEILDKARGDFLSKAIVILQSLWFIVQCVARGKQGLALTELELVTLALATLNGVMYFFWWYKPLGVKEPIKVYPKGERPNEIIINKAGRLDRIKAPKLSPFQRLVVCPFQQVRCSLSQLPHGLRTTSSSGRSYFSSICRRLSPLTLYRPLNDQHKEAPGKDERSRDSYLSYLVLPIYWFIFMPCFALAKSLISIANTTTLGSHKTHVPTFYAPNTDSSNDPMPLVVFFLPSFAAIFGALHCIAWNFHFPSHIEQLLWRIGSLTITLIPSIPVVFTLLAFAAILVALVIAIPISIILSFFENKYGFYFSIPSVSLPQSVKIVLMGLAVTLSLILGFLGVAGLLAYMLARLLLLTQAIMLLREQPESAFYAIDWAHFLPHM